MGQEYSDETATKIDAEIRRVVDEAYQMASDVLNEHREELDKVSLLLMEHESIDKVEFEAVVAGEPRAARGQLVRRLERRHHRSRRPHQGGRRHPGIS